MEIKKVNEYNAHLRQLNTDETEWSEDVMNKLLHRFKMEYDGEITTIIKKALWCGYTSGIPEGYNRK